MISFNEVSQLIDNYSEGPSFLGEIPFEKIREAEAKLGVKFPKSYRDFLRRYGCGNFGGEIYGLTMRETGVPSTVWYTLKLREEGSIPTWMVIVYFEDEYVFCLDTSRFDENEECQVVSWVTGLPFDQQPYEFRFRSFAEFLNDCVHRAIEEGWWK